MPTGDRQPHTLWNAPSDPDCNTMEKNGITAEIVARISAANTAVEPSDITERLKPFETKLEETANGRVVY